MMATRTNRGVLLSAVIAATASMAMAHEHHEDEIPDGSAVSAEPLVSFYLYCCRRLEDG